MQAAVSDNHLGLVDLYSGTNLRENGSGAYRFKSDNNLKSRFFFLLLVWFLRGRMQ